MDRGEKGETARPPAKPRAPKSRLSLEKREKFLEVLGQTGNRRLAAEAIGVDARLMDQRREFDPLLDRQWREAAEQADRRLAGANGPLDCIGGAEPMVIRRGSGGKLRMVKAGRKRWSRPVEERFFATLAACGNISASARAVGFCQSTIDQRRRRFPGFAQKMEEALEDAEVEIEFRMAAEVRGRWQASPSASLGTNEASDAERFDMDSAMRFLKWREEKRQGRNRYGRRDLEHRAKAIEEMPIEAVREEVMRRIAAIRAHEARRRAEAEEADEQGPGGGADGGGER